MSETKSPHELVMEAFNEFKSANDANLKARDVVLDEKLDRINASLDKYEDVNARIAKQGDIAKSIQDQLDAVEKAVNRTLLPGLGGNADDKSNLEIRNGFEHFLRHAPEARDHQAMRPYMEYHNTLVKTVDTGAGYLLAPPEVQKEILKDIIEQSNFRGLASVKSISGDSYQRPKKLSNAGPARRVGETEQRVNTGDPSYGMLTFKSEEMYARGEISQQMLEDSAYDLVGELQGDWVDQFSIKENVETIVGTGANGQCEGILTASGIGEVVSGAAAAITTDGLIDLYYALKSAYSKNASFILQRSSLAAIRKLKLADGSYVWQPGIIQTQPNTILNSTYHEMPDMPAIAAGTYPVAYGDWKRAYVIVDRLGLSMQTDFITLADYGIVVFRARRRVGGGVMVGDAYKKLKISA